MKEGGVKNFSLSRNHLRRRAKRKEEKEKGEKNSVCFYDNRLDHEHHGEEN